MFILKIRSLVFVLLLPFFVAAQNAIYVRNLHQPYSLKNTSLKNAEEIIELPDQLEDFSVEFWLVNHVNQPVGFSLDDQDGRVIFRYFNNKAQIEYNAAVAVADGFKNYWYHFVVNVSPQQISVFLNGKPFIKNTPLTTESVQQLKINGLLDNEPYMSLNDLVKTYSVYDEILQDKIIERHFADYASALDNGEIPSGKMQLLVAPFLSFPSHKSINICWETNRPSAATIRYGNAYPLQSELSINSAQSIRNIQLTGLTPGSPYFAEVEITSGDSTYFTEKLSFSTASEQTAAFRFGVLGDTESRPFVNARLAEKIWEDRPEFFVLLGDVTDGGKQAYKEQWTTEFFTGTAALMQRVPVIPLPGNGDGDLYWFNRYFNPPATDGYYKYSWANADFFILHSTQKQELAPDGQQYQWLEKQLRESKADWKFVMFHHAPYSSDDNDYGNSYEGATTKGDLRVRKLVPLFDQYQVDVVFYGHLHCYERSWPIFNNQVGNQGVVYIVSGGAGGNPEDFAPHRTFFSAKTYRGYHYLMVNIFDKTLNLSTYAIEGNLIDTYKIEK